MNDYWLLYNISFSINALKPWDMELTLTLYFQYFPVAQNIFRVFSILKTNKSQRLKLTNKKVIEPCKYSYES